jgi:hypothetical protein
MKIQTCSSLASLTCTATLNQYVYDRVKAGGSSLDSQSIQFDLWLHQQLLFADYNKV